MGVATITIFDIPEARSNWTAVSLTRRSLERVNAVANGRTRMPAKPSHSIIGLVFHREPSTNTATAKSSSCKHPHRLLLSISNTDEGSPHRGERAGDPYCPDQPTNCVTVLPNGVFIPVLQHI